MWRRRNCVARSGIAFGGFVLITMVLGVQAQELQGSGELTIGAVQSVKYPNGTHVIIHRSTVKYAKVYNQINETDIEVEMCDEKEIVEVKMEDISDKVDKCPDDPGGGNLPILTFRWNSEFEGGMVEVAAGEYSPLTGKVETRGSVFSSISCDDVPPAVQAAAADTWIGDGTWYVDSKETAEKLTRDGERNVEIAAPALQHICKSGREIYIVGGEELLPNFSGNFTRKWDLGGVIDEKLSNAIAASEWQYLSGEIN